MPPPPTGRIDGYYYNYYVYFGDSQDSGRLAFILTNAPRELTLHNCTQSVKDGDNVTCECTTQREGQPPPILSWRGQATSVLHFTDVRLDKVQATYTCEMIWGNRSQTVSYSFGGKLGDPGELTLKNCPQSVKDGDNVTCECTTQRIGHPPPILSWRGQTTSVLHFTDVRLDKVEATYTCEMTWRNLLKTVSYSFGGKLVHPGELTLKNCPKSVKDGDNITCECTTQRTGRPPPILSWRGQTTSVLHLTDVRLDKVQATYTCEMIWGNRSQTVSYSFEVKIGDPGELTLKNCPQSVKDGDNVTCECTTQRTVHPPPILSWRWQTTSVLHFTDVRLDKVQATYTCEMIWENLLKTVSYSFGGKLVDPGELTLKNCPQRVKDGDNITCECTTQRTGHPPPILSWRGQTTSVLHFTDVRLDKVQATYTCEMTWGNLLKAVSYSFGGKLGELFLSCRSTIRYIARL